MGRNWEEGVSVAGAVAGASVRRNLLALRYCYGTGQNAVCITVLEVAVYLGGGGCRDVLCGDLVLVGLLVVLTDAVFFSHPVSTCSVMSSVAVDKAFN